MSSDSDKVMEKAILESPDLPSEAEFNIRELGRSIWRQKPLVATSVTVFTLFSLAISFVIPKTYAADATILPRMSADPGSAIAAGMAAQLGAAGMLGGLGLASNKTGDLVEILSSRSMAERIIERCQLEREFQGWKTRGQLVNRVLRMRTITPPSIKNKVIGIHVDAPRAELAALIANGYVDELKTMLDEIGYNSASKNRKFIESQLSRTKSALATSEEELARYQAKSQIASLPETVMASIRAISDLQAQNITAEAQLKSTDEVINALRAKAFTLQSDPNSTIEMEIKRQGLLAQRDALDRAQKSFLDKLSSLPPKGMALARLQRDVQVHNAVFLALTQQYQTAIINENKDSDAFLVLDKATVPERPSKPKKSLVVLLGLLSGVFIGLVIALLKERRNRELV